MDRIAAGRNLRALMVVLVVIGSLLAAALPAGASARAHGAGRHTLRIKGQRHAHRRATFNLRSVRGTHILRARLVARHRHVRVPSRLVRRAVHRGMLTLRMSPRIKPRRRTRPVLVVTVADPVATSVPAAAAPAPPAADGAHATLSPPHAPILADTDAAAHVRRSSFEPRPGNGTPNGTVPDAQQLAAFRAASTNWGDCSDFAAHITGDFTGTTDEILQWAAWKWGIDEDLLRAVAVKETSWNQSFVGDNGESFGLMQVKRGVQAGTFPLARDSTAFNVDYYAAILRYYYDGCGTWLNDVEHGTRYAEGDIWGAVGAWYSGRWHTAAAEGYIAAVKANMAGRVWALPRF